MTGVSTDKIRTTQHQLVELTAFGAQLQPAAAQLSVEPAHDAPCGEDGVCATAVATTSMNSMATLDAKSDPPIACTLEPNVMADRVADWNAVLQLAQTRSVTTDGALRVEFSDGIDVAELSRLAAAEQQCCAFFSFAITIDTRGAALEVRAPDAAADIVSAVFGQPAGSAPVIEGA